MKINLVEIGSQLNFESWQKLKEKVNELTKFPSRIEDTLLFAKRITVKNKIVPVPSTTACIKKGHRTFYLFNNTNSYSASTIFAWFECRSCTKEFKVEYNPARCYLDSFLCKLCKKSVLHKCKDYRLNYETSMLKKYKVKRPLQSKEIMKTFNDSMIEKYGVKFSGQNPESLAKTKAKTKFAGCSRLELAVGEALEKCYGTNRVKRDPNQKIKIKEKTYVYPDILLDEKIVVEVFGDYWHANPALYNENKVIAKGKASEIWNVDKTRIDNLNALGYKVIIVWEKDWKENKEKVLKEIDEQI